MKTNGAALTALMGLEHAGIVDEIEERQSIGRDRVAPRVDDAVPSVTSK